MKTQKIKIISALILSISLFACSQKQAPKTVGADFSSGIINGEPVEASEQQYKMTARLVSHSAGGVWYPACTVSILSEDLILTAAHCVEGEKASNLRIAYEAQPLTVAGQSNHKTRVDVVAQFKTSEVLEFVVHPLYGKSDYDQDMALIRIKGTIPEGFMPTELLSDEQMKSIQEDLSYEVMLVGYGLFSETPMKESEILRKTIVPAKFEGFHLITDQTKGSGGCNGDSGGPAYLHFDGKIYLVGVTHGPTLENLDCYHEGVWGNPNFEKAFFNEAAEKMGSATRFQ